MTDLCVVAEVSMPCFCWLVVALVGWRLGMVQTSQASWEQSVLGADVSGSSRRMRITVTCPDRSVRVFLTRRDDYEAWLDALQKASSRRIEEHYGTLGGVMRAGDLLSQPFCHSGCSGGLREAVFSIVVAVSASHVCIVCLYFAWTMTALCVFVGLVGLQPLALLLAALQ